jgi:murein DD-endopeptidase MepM/ murein hydrolase activator NlpD
LSLFNPFYALPAELSIGRLRYEFVFGTVGIDPTASAVVEVAPVEYRGRARLVLPVDGPAIDYDGHDFYSHHRLIPLGGPLARRAGLTTNPVRYANDLTPVGPNGELTRGDLATPADWYAHGAAVRAPAAGVVVSALNDVPENSIERGERVVPASAQDGLAASLGNHVIVRHGPGEFSLLAHLLVGSVPVAVGDSVSQGQQVGRIGFSGDTGFHVHVHQMLMNAPTLSAEGLPSYFDRIRRVALPRRAGAPGPVLTHARLDTGDIVEAVR